MDWAFRGKKLLPMARIDAHQHFWKYDPVRDSWINEAMHKIRRDFLPEHYRRVAAGHLVLGSVLMEGEWDSRDPVGEMRWKPPQAAPGWTGVRDAANFGPPCHPPEARPAARVAPGPVILHPDNCAVRRAADVQSQRFSFFHWTRDAFLASSLAPSHVLAGLALLAGWVLFVQATRQSLGLFGIMLVGSMFAVLMWILFFYDVVKTTSSTRLTWIVLIGVAVILTTGMCWAHLRRRLSGQATVDEVRD